MNLNLLIGIIALTIGWSSCWYYFFKTWFKKEDDWMLNRDKPLI